MSYYGNKASQAEPMSNAVWFLVHSPAFMIIAFGLGCVIAEMW